MTRRHRLGQIGLSVLWRWGGTAGHVGQSNCNSLRGREGCTGGLNRYQLDTYASRVAACLPDGGRVSILQFTDKQYERILNFKGRKRQPTPKPPDQFDLF